MPSTYRAAQPLSPHGRQESCKKTIEMGGIGLARSLRMAFRIAGA
jgi:hypothetical protein